MDKITILLHEYDTLRNETIQRNTVMFQSIGIYAAVLIGLIIVISQKGFNCTMLSLLVGATVLFLCVLTWIDSDVARAAAQVRRLESDINTRAGEPLLTWQSSMGFRGMIGRFFVNAN
jgi:hypothetical protein